MIPKLPLVLFLHFSFYFLFTNAQLPEDYNYEFRAVWMTTAYNLDWPSKNTLTPDQQRNEFIKVLDKVDSMNFNAVIVQIRASADAFYKSEFEPWSYWLTGKQGQEPHPYYDPLTFMIDECHKRNIQFHAWFNLLRAVPHTKFFPTTKAHVTRQHSSWFYKSKNALYFDPGIPEVRNYLVKIIADVTHRYDVDGIHLDDYFYPQEIGGNRIKDASTFKKYGRAFKNIEDWRRENVNDLVKNLSDTLSSIKKWVRFGISPVAVWRHQRKDSLGSMTRTAITAYDDLYADSKKWAEEGWVDYIMPQLYAGTGARDADIVCMANWWQDCDVKCDRYGGLAYYKTMKPSTHYWKDQNELSHQVGILRERNFNGIGLYRSADVMNGNFKVDSVLYGTHFTSKALFPPLYRKDSVAPASIKKLAIQKYSLTWETEKATDGDFPIRFWIYGFESVKDISFANRKGLLGVSQSNSFEIEEGVSACFIMVVAEDRNGNLSSDNQFLFFKP